MAKLAGIDVPKLIGTEIGKVLGADPAYTMTLISVTPGARGGDLTQGNNPTEVSHACKGIMSDYSAVQIDGTLIKHGDRRILLLASKIADAAVPKQSDKITAEGQTWRVVYVTRDPVAATYDLQVRGA